MCLMCTLLLRSFWLEWETSRIKQTCNDFCCLKSLEIKCITRVHLGDGAVYHWYISKFVWHNEVCPTSLSSSDQHSGTCNYYVDIALDSCNAMTAKQTLPADLSLRISRLLQTSWIHSGQLFCRKEQSDPQLNHMHCFSGLRQSHHNMLRSTTKCLQ